MVSLIDIASTLDDKNNPVGHGLKILRDLPSIFEDDVEILARKEYLQLLKKKGTMLPCRIYSGIHKGETLKMLCNYFISLFTAKGDVLVYTITLEPLLWGIAIYKRKRKIVAITCWNWDKYLSRDLSKHPIRKLLVQKGLERLDGCIVTNYMYKPKVPGIRIPDYYITDEINQYKKSEKLEGCVCLGEIRPGKDIVGLIRVMKKTEIPLLVAGSFQDRKLYQKAKKLSSKNIIVENINLPYDRYMTYLSSYKYVVLPYDVRHYDGRTSGVLLEGIFLGAVPIAPKSLLQQNHIQGLGYKSISEIPELISLYEAGKITVNNNLQKYQLDEYKEKMSKFLKKLKV
ncbi:MAG: hypothetical protein J1D87_02430 [Lachnospiraceae bacterium]|nr:hypothetical protein [Lachnospiraceae bacterium]